MKKFVKENKLVSSMIGFLFTCVILWGIWTTCQINAQDKENALNKNDNQSISKQVDEIKVEITSFKKEVKEDISALKKDIGDGQKELLKLLIDIKKNNKNK